MIADNLSSIKTMCDAEAVALAREITFEQLFLLLSGKLNVSAIKKKTDHDAALSLMVMGLKEHCPILGGDAEDYVAHGKFMPTLFITMALANIKIFKTVALEHVGFQRQIPWLKAYALAVSQLNGDALELRFLEEWTKYAPRVHATQRKAAATIKKPHKIIAPASKKRLPYSAVKPAPPKKIRKVTPPKPKTARPQEIIPKQHWQKTLLESLPGIGVRTSTALIARFGSASGVFMASVKELCSVDGVGPHMAENIAAAMEQALDRVRAQGLDVARLRAIPGIGTHNAAELLAHFGSVQAIFAASLTELVAVPLVGRRTAGNIVYAAKGTYR